MTEKVGLGQLGAVRPQKKAVGTPGTVDKGKFQAILGQELEKKAGIKFSAHAEQRLVSRGIKLTPERMQSLNAAVDRAADKGAQDSLVLMDSLAFIVSVKNRTVVTAVDGESRKENVFTNIDSAVIV